MIAVQGLTKYFRRQAALDNVSLHCGPARAIALIGPNGSGKTTLIKSLLGLVIPDAGTIEFFGESVRGKWQYRERVGYMPQMGRFPDHMRVGQIFDMMTDLRKTHHSRVDRELIELFGVDELFHKPMYSLSGGMRQKVSACLAFMFSPEILMLDEPTAGLDPLSTEQLKDRIRRERDKGRLVIITSHILSDLDDMVDEVIYMQEGRIRFHKPIALLRQETGEKRLNRVMAALMQRDYATPQVKVYE